MVLQPSDNLAAIEASISCFKAQEWEAKELVVINMGSGRFLLPGSTRCFQLKFRHPGEALNAAYYNAAGEWCVVWRPDSLYGSKYIQLLMRERQKSSLLVVANPKVKILSTSQDLAVDGLRYVYPAFKNRLPIRFTDSGDESELIRQFPPDDFRLVRLPPVVWRCFSDYEQPA